MHSIICILLISQFWASTVTYCNWMINSSTDLISLFNSEDGEAEEKEQEKQEKDDRLPVDLYTVKLHGLLSLIDVFDSKTVLSIYHADISTPPPEYLPYCT